MWAVCVSETAGAPYVMCAGVFLCEGNAGEAQQRPDAAGGPCHTHDSCVGEREMVQLGLILMRRPLSPAAVALFNSLKTHPLALRKHEQDSSCKCH